MVAEQTALIETLRAEVAALRRQAGRDCLLTELPDVAAAQEASRPRGPIVAVPETSRLPGRGCHIASLIATETGHTVLNHLPSFSSLPIFDISRSGP